MNFQGSFKKIGSVDISLLKSLVEQLTDEHWSLSDVRQRRYEVHKDTQSISIVYDEDFRHMNPTVHPAYNLFGPALREIFKSVADFYESQPEIHAKLGADVKGYFVRVTLVKLRAGGSINGHKDMNFSLAHSHRLHVPVITNDAVEFHVGPHTEVLKEGEIVEINNRRMHSVENKGETDRVHLILDWAFPWEPCCCRDKVHPGEPCTPEACLATDRLQIACNCHPEEADA